MGTKRLTHEEFLERLHQVNDKADDFELLTRYISSKDLIKCRCKICGHEWETKASNLLKNCGCRECWKRSLMRGNDSFVKEFNERNPHADTIELLSEYVDSDTKIRCRCKIHKYEWENTPHHLLYGQGCKLCGYQTIKIKERYSQNKFLDNFNKTKNADTIEILGEYVNSTTPIDCRCKVCSYEWSPKPYYLTSEHGCPVCNNNIVLEGYNDVKTTNPKMAKLFLNEEEAIMYTQYSNKYALFKCPDCGYVKKSKILDIARNGFCCPKCSDNISYPNKILRYLLEQLPIGDDYKLEYSPDWIKPKRYDSYFVYNNQQYIIEMDGGWHYKDNHMSGQTVEETQEIDKFKDEKAIENGIKMIRIDCKTSTIDYISKRIIESELSSIFNLSNIDWVLIDKKSSTNLMKEICEYYENNIYASVQNIADTFKMSYEVVRKILRKGQKFGWCNYNTKEALFRSSKSIEVFKDDISLGIFNSASMIEELSEKTFGIKLKSPQISVSCNYGRRYNGFIFKYVKTN